MKKTTSNLSIPALTAKYDVAACGTTKFEAALHDGTILEAIRASAEANLNGQMMAQIKQLKKNCASQRCHRKDRDVVTTADTNIDSMVDMFDEFLTGLADIEGGGSKRSKVPFYTYSREQMEDMSLDQLRKLGRSLSSWYSVNGNSESSVLPEKLGLYNRIEAWTKDFYEVRDSKSPEPKVDLSEKLMAKLNAGKAASLSKAEAAELAELLKKLQG